METKKTTTNKGNKTMVSRKSKAIEKVEAEITEGMRKPNEFKTYLLWKAIPSPFFNCSEDELQEMGIIDQMDLVLLKIKTQREFAKKYNLMEKTLSDWNDKIRKNNLIEGVIDWAKQRTKEITGAFFLKTFKDADAARVRLWFELFEDKKPVEKPTVLNQQFNQYVIKLGEEYDRKLAEEYERQLTKEEDEVYRSK